MTARHIITLFVTVKDASLSAWQGTGELYHLVIPDAAFVPAPGELVCLHAPDDDEHSVTTYVKRRYLYLDGSAAVDLYAQVHVADKATAIGPRGPGSYEGGHTEHETWWPEDGDPRTYLEAVGFTRWRP